MRLPTVRGGRPESGIALLLVVWLLALFTVIAGEFMASGRVKAAAERNKRDDLGALALALAGYRSALAALDRQIEGLELDEDGALLLHYRGFSEAVAARADDVPLGEGSYSWSIVDEEGLVNLNKAGRRLLEGLLRQCGLELGVERDTVIDSILDWRDANRDHRANGAEEDYYRGLAAPYSCKDGPFDLVEELRLVRGVTAELYAGAEVDGKRKPGLRDLVSVHAPERPNAWTAPREVLEATSLVRPAPPAKPTEVSRHYAITASGKGAAGSPPRTVRAVVLREESGDSRSFTLVYWNDSHIAE